jgi:hypothetical protein
MEAFLSLPMLKKTVFELQKFVPFLSAIPKLWVHFVFHASVTEHTCSGPK